MNLDKMDNVPTFRETFAKAVCRYVNYEQFEVPKTVSKEDYGNYILNMLRNKFKGMSDEAIFSEISFNEGSKKLFHDVSFVTSSINAEFGNTLVTEKDVFRAVVNEAKNNSLYRDYSIRVKEFLVIVHDYGYDNKLVIEIF